MNGKERQGTDDQDGNPAVRHTTHDTRNAGPETRHTQHGTRNLPSGLTFRAIVISLVLAWLAGYWVRQSEIIALACQGTEAVPSIPGVGALVALVMVNSLLRRQRRIRPLTVAELVTIFLFVTVSSTMMGCGIGRFLLACITAPFYYSSPAAPLEELARFIPSWLAPQDPAVHRWLYESSPTGQVPWGVWQAPIIAWTGFFFVFGAAILCLMVLFNEPWVEQERLVFPLVRLPMQIMDPRQGAVPFFRARATWIGMGVALVLNAINIVRGVFFGGPSGGFYVNIGTGLTGAPWNAALPVSLHLRPELVGLGYLISTELSFSIWFFQALLKAQAIFFSAVGYRVSGAPFGQEQGIGGYVVLAAFLVWKGRGPFLQAWGSWVGGRGPASGSLGRERGALSRATPPVSAAYRWALAGSVAGLLAVLIFWRAAGLSPWLAVVYLYVLVSVSVVYGRLRAETGVPIVWAFPYGLQHKAVRYFVNSRLYTGLGPDYRSGTLYTLLIFLSRGYFPTVSGYGIEGLTLGKQAGLAKAPVFGTLLAAIAMGAAASFYFHLVPYYQKGAVGLRGGLWGSEIAQAEYAALYQAAQMPVPPDVPRIIATLSGGGFLALLTLVRARFLGSPFSPLGYALACSYGDLLWGSFFLVWIIKTILLRYGGHKAYLAALPGFLGFALGHFIVAGAIWGSLGAALGGAFLRYGVWFG